MREIKDCFVFTNGMVMAFDKNGKQITECQGFILDVADKLLSYCNKQTQWHFAKWQEWAIPVNFNWRWEKDKKIIWSD
ncbi:hypothetical protein J7J62_03975 [bacterium]|nr:hypothetical protein [bacterium]